MNAPDLVKYFANAWQQRYDVKYVPSWGKDTSIFKQLLGEFTDHELKTMINFYINDLESDFIEQGGRSIGIFRLSLPQIITGVQKDTKAKADALNANKSDFERLTEARKKLL